MTVMVMVILMMTVKIMTINDDDNGDKEKGKKQNHWPFYSQIFGITPATECMLSSVYSTTLCFCCRLVRYNILKFLLFDSGTLMCTFLKKVKNAGKNPGKKRKKKNQEKCRSKNDDKFYILNAL